MKISEILAFATGGIIFIIGAGMTILYTIISIKHGGFEYFLVTIGICMMAVGWLLTIYAVKSSGKGILHVLLELL